MKIGDKVIYLKGSAGGVIKCSLPVPTSSDEILTLGACIDNVHWRVKEYPGIGIHEQSLRKIDDILNSEIAELMESCNRDLMKAV